MLDASFKSLDISGGEDNHPFIMIDPLDLFSVINHRCPNIHSLSLTISFPGKQVSFFTTCHFTMDSFKLLTALNLSMCTVNAPISSIQHVIDLLQLLPFISQRCPNVQSLSLSFGRPDDKKVPFVPLFDYFFKSFNHFTNLRLEWYTQTTASDFLPVLTALGEDFPKIRSLEIDSDIPFGEEQLLALVLGRRRELLLLTPHRLQKKLRVDDSTVAVFCAQSLSPICSTLQQLKLFVSNIIIGLSKNMVAFILRRFVNLNKMSRSHSSFTVAQAVQLLHQQQLQSEANPLNGQNVSLDLGRIE